MMQAAQLSRSSEQKTTVLLCFERDPHSCHRSLLIDATMPGATVTHLFP